MVVLRKELEDRVLARLSLLKPALRKVDVYNGELSGVNEAEEFRRKLGGQVPGVLVSTLGGNYRDHKLSRRSATKDVTLDLIVIAGSLRTREDQQRKPGGAYELLQSLEGLLLGFETGIEGISRLTPQSEEVLYHGEDLVVWRVSYVATADAVRGAETEGEILSLRALHGLSDDENEAADPLVTADTVLP